MRLIAGVGGPDEQMKVVAHQAVAVEFKRLALFQVGQRLQKRLESCGL